MRVALIWAQAENRTIGINNSLPWYLPNDLKYFKKVTLGKPIIMGRKTFDSIGKPLPGRTNIVISRDKDLVIEGVEVVSTVDEAISRAEAQSVIDGQDEVIVIGGAQIYDICLPKADKLYLTQVHAQVEGDAFFPEFDLGQFEEIESETFKAEGPNPYDYSFKVFNKRV